VVSTAAVTELPLNGRNYADLALLSTNAVKSPIADSFSASGTPREGAFNVNGMRSTYNNFLLDGLDNNAYGTSNQGYSAQLVQLSPTRWPNSKSSPATTARNTGAWAARW
jgi:hypothetical protein